MSGKQSAQAAIDSGSNSFATGGALSMTDLQNVSQSSGSGYAVSAGLGAGGDKQPAGSTGVGSYEGSNQSSTTRAGISGIAGDQSVRTGDSASAGTLVRDWNTQAIVQNVQAQAQITQQFNQNAVREIGTYADRQRDAALARGDRAEAAKWDEGGEYRVAAHAAAGAFSGGVAGALGAGASAALMPRLGQAIEAMGLPAPVAQAVGAATAAAIGATVGGAAGAAGAFSVDINNRQLHPTEAKLIKDNAARFAKQLYGTDSPTEEQIKARGAMLANTAQSQLDNNVGYAVAYSKEADDFLQALKIEYMQQNGTMNLPGTQGTQQLFYATVDQKNQPSLNQGLADPGVTTLIVRTPLAPSYNNPTNDPGRDKLTGLPLDDQGRYTVQTSIGDKVYEAKYFPCATTECVAGGKNLDMSDPATQSYVKAVDKMILDDINQGTTIVTIVSPLGAAGGIASVLGPVTSVTSGVISNQGVEAAAKEAVQFAATKYLQNIYGFTEAPANRITASVDLVADGRRLSLD